MMNLECRIMNELVHSIHLWQLSRAEMPIISNSLKTQKLKDPKTNKSHVNRTIPLTFYRF